MGGTLWNADKRSPGTTDDALRGPAEGAPDLTDSVFDRFGRHSVGSHAEEAEAAPTVADSPPARVTAEPRSEEVPMTDAVRRVLRETRHDSLVKLLVGGAILLVLLPMLLAEGAGGIRELSLLVVTLMIASFSVKWHRTLGRDLAEPTFLRLTAPGQISRRDSRSGNSYYLQVGEGVELQIQHPNYLDEKVRHTVDIAPRTIHILGQKEVAVEDRLVSAAFTKHRHLLLELRDAAGAVLYRHPEYRPAEAGRLENGT
jgi:hypothetical protein